MPLCCELARIRDYACVNQGHVAVHVGVSQPTISNWENGNQTPNYAQFCRWIEILCRSIEQRWGNNYLPGQAPATPFTMFMGYAVKVAREEAGYNTQAELAEHLGTTTPCQISNWENGKQEIPLLELFRIVTLSSAVAI